MEKYKEIECLDCGSRDLVDYREQIVTEKRKINKDGTISKRFKKVFDGLTNCTGIICENCGTCFDYEVNSKKQVIELFRF